MSTSLRDRKEVAERAGKWKVVYFQNDDDFRFVYSSVSDDGKETELLELDCIPPEALRELSAKIRSALAEMPEEEASCSADTP